MVLDYVASNRKVDTEIMDHIARNAAVEEIALWRLAVDIQQRRIMADHEALDDLLTANAATADVRLYIVALRNLLRAVEFATEVFPEYGTQLRQAEQQFSQQVPDASAIRNILEHFDAYAKGIGRLHKKPDMGMPPAADYRFTSDGTVVNIALYRYSEQDNDFVVAVDVRLDTAVATAAALRMADDALNLVG
jgi:hypothetical protein